MSYILEALRKSERQRQAGQVPSLPALVSDPPPRRQPWLAALVVALVLFNAAGLGYLWLKGRSKSPAGPPTPVASVAPAGAPEGPSAAARDKRPAVDLGAGTPPPKAAKPAAAGPPKPQPPRTARRTGPGSAASSPALAGPSAAGTVPLPSPPSPPKTPPKPLAEGLPEPFSAEAPPAGAPPHAGLPAAPEEERRAAAGPTISVPSRRPEDGVEESGPVRRGDPPLLRAMPPEFRERVPAFKINLYAYSKVPAERFAIIDMKKYRVGDRIPGGALLLEMRSDSLVLELEGTKFRVPRL